MKNIILLSLFQDNGGIASWSKKFVKTFNNDEYNIVPVDRSVTGRKFEETGLLNRIVAGLRQMKQILHDVEAAIKEKDAKILHTTTSGSLGTLRDYRVACLCRKYGVKSIMHCRYGCITEDLHRPFYGRFLRKTMAMYDQVWVLDSRSAKTMRQYTELSGKVHVTPNSISVRTGLVIEPKSYRHVAFIANLIPSKGLFELIEAVVRINRDDLRLSVVGTGTDDVIEKAHLLAGDRLGKTINFLGRLPNEEAIEFIKTVDILALPTYYPWEAFPISILEAMSLGKLVISTSRAAIKDMLTALDGQMCGILVREKSVNDIVDAITWCIEHCSEADDICNKAYLKVLAAYSTDVVYKQYKSLYDKCLCDV